MNTKARHITICVVLSLAVGVTYSLYAQTSSTPSSTKEAAAQLLVQARSAMQQGNLDQAQSLTPFSVYPDKEQFLKDLEKL